MGQVTSAIWHFCYLKSTLLLSSSKQKIIAIQHKQQKKGKYKKKLANVTSPSSLSIEVATSNTAMSSSSPTSSTSVHEIPSTLQTQQQGWIVDGTITAALVGEPLKITKKVVNRLKKIESPILFKKKTILTGRVAKLETKLIRARLELVHVERAQFEREQPSLPLASTSPSTKNQQKEKKKKESHHQMKDIHGDANNANDGSISKKRKKSSNSSNDEDEDEDEDEDVVIQNK